jgi:F0F1-type ATP synthase gamma subunit
MLGDDYHQRDLIALFTYIDVHAAQYRSISLAFNFFKNILIQIPQSLTLYPLDMSQVEALLIQTGIKLGVEAKKSDDDTIIEPSVSQVNKEILRQIKQYIIMAALLQNKLTEHAQRMMAMK